MRFVLARESMTLGPAQTLEERPKGRIPNVYECEAFIRIAGCAKRAKNAHVHVAIRRSHWIPGSKGHGLRVNTLSNCSSADRSVALGQAIFIR
jgi:hypothetical protein